MVEDLKRRDAIRESMQKEKFENSGIGQIYQGGLPPHVEQEKNMYP